MEKSLIEGGLPLLYEAMLEVRHDRHTSAYTNTSTTATSTTANTINTTTATCHPIRYRPSG